MNILQAENNKLQPVKVRQINVRLTAEQERLLKQYRVRNGVTTQEAVVQALQA